MTWRLQVVDGADAQRLFPLPDAGTMVIGNSHKYADICLNDLYVSRIHCQIEIEEGRVLVTAMAEDRDTLVNGRKITQSELHLGEVLRVGNSHLRLEPHDGSAADEAAEVVDGEVVEGEPAEPEWDNLEILAGTDLGHFKLHEMLGRGHYGVVFKARDMNDRREVALKVIGPEFPHDVAELQRFAKTIKTIATIHEDHLVRWYAAGKSSRYVWIAQELIEGESLSQVLERISTTTSSKVRWRNALKLGLDIAKALDCLFQRHLVHGNVTPSNILVAIDRTAKLNDLMFEQAIKDSVWHRTQLEGKLLAELPYLAPERIEPGAYWDGLADIYSLGVCVYARLTGHPPFQGETPGETIELIRTGKPEKPRKIIKDCPEMFQAVVLRMLAKNQEDRYQTPAQVIEDLERCQSLA